MDQNRHIPHYLIESFLATAENQTFEKAAEKLGLTQPAISRQMQLFEELVPYKVFTLDGRKKTLTKYGQMLHRLLADQFSQTQELINQASLLFSDSKAAHIKICGRGEFLDVIAKSLNFSGKVSFFNMDNSHALESVLNRQCDIGVIHTAGDSSELVLKRFFTSRLRIVVPKYFLSTKPSTKKDVAAQLLERPCLLYKREDRVVENFLKEFGLNISDLNVARVYSNYATLIHLVSQGHGWSIIPSNLEIIDEQKYQIYQLTGRTQDERTFYLCFRKELRDAAWFNELLSELKSAIS